MTAKPFFYDITLRDANQALAKPWNKEQKEIVFKQLLKLGVQGVEVGFPIASEMDFASCQSLARLTAELASKGSKVAENLVIAGLARAKNADIQKAWEAVMDAPKPRIHVFLAMSPLSMENVLQMEPAAVRTQAIEAVSFAKSLVGEKGDIEFSPEHFGDCVDNFDFVLESLKHIVEAGATTINLPNTVERYRPMLYVDMVRRVAEALPKNITISVHCHNDLGMATAATVESYFAGATQMECALNGLGERSGNTNMYEVAVALHNSGVEMDLNLGEIYETALLTSKWANVPIYAKAPLIGIETVAHRSGIHQDGASKTKNMKKGAYRPIDYSLIGRNENDILTFTSQSGKTAVYEILSCNGYPVELDEAAELQPVLKEISEREGELSHSRILKVFKEKYCNFKGRLNFISVNVTPERKDHYVFNFEKDGISQKKSIETMKGPIEAALLLSQEIGLPVKFNSYKQSVVSNADEESAGKAFSEIALSANGKSVIGRGISSSTLIANMRAVFGGINKLYRD
jgi:2-isopropylmalate synthase